MSTIKIGWAKRDVSTTEPVNVHGQMYIRVSEGIHDPITVTAMALDGGEGQDAAIFVSCDISTIQRDVTAVVRDKVAARRQDIPLQAILMNATHSHSSADNSPTPEASPDGKKIYPGLQYREFFTDQVVDAICEAWDNRAEGGIAYGYGFAVVGHSRRTVYLKDQGVDNPMSGSRNGFAKMYGSTNTPDFSHYEAGADHFLNVMFTVDASDKLTGVVINVPCPSQTSEHFTKLSADYWNEVREAVAREFGPEVFVLGQCAAAGDTSPRLPHYKGAQCRRAALKYDLHYDLRAIQDNNADEYAKVMCERRDIAEQIITGVKDIYSWAMKDIQREVRLRNSAANVPLSRRVITEEELSKCQEHLQKLEEITFDPATMSPEEYSRQMSRRTSYMNRNKSILRRYEELKTNPKTPCEVHVVQVGPIAFVTNPFELFQDFMHRIQARSPFIQTFVVQLTGNVGGGYLSTKRGTFNKGYSASMFCNQIGYEGGQEYVEYALEKLNEFASQD